MATTGRMFAVSLSDPKKTGGISVHLRVPHGEAQVERLKGYYETVTAQPIEEVKLPPANEFHAALTALIRLYKSAGAKQDHALARRAEKAVGELLGEQKHLKGDDEEPMRAREDTLIGVGGGR